MTKLDDVKTLEVESPGVLRGYGFHNLQLMSYFFSSSGCYNLGSINVHLMCEKGLIVGFQSLEGAKTKKGK